MASAEKRPLKVFLCHASGDKPPVRDLYRQLSAEGVDAWLDQEKLLPGQDWRLEIPNAVREADVVVICLSQKSITKEGYVQREIKFALDIAEEKPEGTIFLIPARLEDCPVPERLGRWHWVDLYEQNGFGRLLRSLKLRADAVGAAVEPISGRDTEEILDRRLEQLYTEGLAAFYTDDWDTACQRFQAVLREQPDHRKAADKLSEAECLRYFAGLYAQASNACGSGNWPAAIRALEELTQKSPDYRDAAALLRNARKQEQLGELYAEARALHAAGKWQAVVRVFEQISGLDPAYPDPRGLLASAQTEVAELERLAALSERYGQALRAMESGDWIEARGLLELIQKSRAGFRETERLLRKAEEEISRAEELRRQHDQISTLYEQAHGLLRAKKWRNALEKLAQIRHLDEGFADTDGIAARAQKELDREEREADRQDTLAALYAEALRLLKEEKYQEALDKWQEVRALEPAYPDRQSIQNTARRKLSALAQPKVYRQQRPMPKAGKVWQVLPGALGFGLVQLLEMALDSLIPGEFLWPLRGLLNGLIAALVLRNVTDTWNWRALLAFGACWAAVYLLVFLVVLKQGSLLFVSVVFSLAPVLSILLFSMWIRRSEPWQQYALILAGWLAAWLIGLGAAGYVPSDFQWVIGYALAGGIGLWITMDLYTRSAKERGLGADIVSSPGSANVLLAAFLGTVVLRAIWGVLQDWLQIWDAEFPALPQYAFLFALGGFYGAIVALSFRRVIPGWKRQQSGLVVIGWACGLGAAYFSGPLKLDFIAPVMGLAGISVATAIYWLQPSIAPLKLVLVFLGWALAWRFGGGLGGSVIDELGTDYAWCFVDAAIILSGLLVTLGVYEYTSDRLARLTLTGGLGFALGNYLVTAMTGLLPLTILLALWGAIGGIVFELPSRNWKKILIRGGLCAIGLVLGYSLALLIMPRHSSQIQNILWGAWLGLAFGLPTRRISGMAVLSILGSALFPISAIAMAQSSYGQMTEAALRGGLIGLMLGFGYAYVTRDAERAEQHPAEI